MCHGVPYIRARMRSSPPGRARAAAKRETREALLRAALEAFAEAGFDAPSLDAICARAGLTRGAFYVHFPDRDALVVAVVQRVVGRFLDAMVSADAAADDLRASVRRFADTIAAARTAAGGPQRLLGEPLPAHRILDAARRSAVIRRQLVAIAGDASARLSRASAAAREAGTLRPDVDPATLGALLVVTAIGVLVASELGLPLDLPALRETVLALVAPPTPDRPAAAGTRRGRRARRA